MIRCMRRTNIYLAAEQPEKLDRLAAEDGVWRAEIIRRLLDRALADRSDDVAADLATIDLSFAALADAEQVAREPGERERHLSQMWRLSE